MIKSEQLQEVVNFLKENKSISLIYKDGIKLIFDAKNDIEALRLLDNSPQNFGVLISSDRMANQCINDIPEIAWDMMDYATTPLTLVLDGGQFVSKHFINEDWSLAVQKLEKGPLFELVSKYSKPIAFFNLSKTQPVQSDLNLVMDEIKLKEKIVRIRLNGEVEIIAN